MRHSTLLNDVLDTEWMEHQYTCYCDAMEADLQAHAPGDAMRVGPVTGQDHNALCRRKCASALEQLNALERERGECLRLHRIAAMSADECYTRVKAIDVLHAQALEQYQKWQQKMRT